MVDELERSGRREVAPRYTDPVGTLRSEMDRLFDTFLGGALPTFPSLFGPGVGRGATLMPRMDVRETDKEIIIEAELPGLEEKDISLTLQNGILTVEGGKADTMRRKRTIELWNAATAASSAHSAFPIRSMRTRSPLTSRTAS
jgi:HSP20 family molecular chaperone IbpA